MGHVVPNWDLDDSSDPARFDLLRHHSVATVPMLGYEMTELTWENGQLSIHGLGPGPNATVETLEAIVDQATQKKQLPPPGKGGIDALVPRGTHDEEQQDDDQAVHVPPLDPTDQRDDTCIVGWPVMKKPRITSPRVPAEKEESFQQSQQSGSVTRSRGDSRHVATVDTCEKESAWVGFETASLSSQGRTLSSSDNPDSTTNTNTINSACLTRQQDEESNEEDKKKGGARSSLSTKRSRAAASHSQSERKRRETINQKMKILQKMVPNSNKTDKASMLDEVIDHLKTLQAQLQMMMMSRMSMPSMMPFAMPQHQLHMPMMPHMGMGMGMDMNIMNPMMACHNLAGLSPVINPTAAFMPPMVPWDVTTGTDRSPSTPTMVAPLDPTSYLAHFQPQPMTMEAYSKMVALIQQQQQQQLASISKS